MSDIAMTFLFGTGFGFWLGAPYWRQVVKKANSQVEYMLDKWKPKEQG